MLEGYVAQPLPRPLPDILFVERLIPDVEEVMFAANSVYVELCYLPVLGPTTTWLYRRLGGLLVWNDSLELESASLAQELGIGQGKGTNAPLWRSINRMLMFDVAYWVADRLLVTMAVPPLSLRHRSRLTTRVLAWEQKLRQAEEEA